MASITSHNPEQTFEFARILAESLKAGDVLALTGDLGAGKTHFVKGLAAGLGHRDEVTSPTFTLLHEYTGGRLPLYHFDFYRLESADEALRIGLDEYLCGDGVVAIEWADKFPVLLPVTARWIDFQALGDARQIIERAAAPGAEP